MRVFVDLLCWIIGQTVIYQQDAIEVYDGVPAYINGTFEDSSRQLGAICGSNPGRDISMYAYSGVITIFFEADLLGEFKSNMSYCQVVTSIVFNISQKDNVN